MISLDDLRARIREVDDFPKPGLTFQDLTPLLADPDCFRTVVDLLAEWAAPRQPELVLGAEARGFILGGALAYQLGAGFIEARRPGKLPWDTVSAGWEPEDDGASLELHADAISVGTRVLVHDDVLATGATAQMKISLVELLGGQVVGVAFVLELEQLQGRRRLSGHDVFSLIRI
jgi:adenine phosphoribosyltransferase